MLATWISHEFPNIQWDIQRLHYPSSSIGPANVIGRFTATGNLGLISKAACVQCNTGWMNNLEKAAKPILVPLMHGRTTVITSDQQMTIVRWLVKTIIMFEFLGGAERGPKFFRPDERHTLMRSLSVPPDTKVFLARYLGSQDILARETRLPILLTGAHPHVKAGSTSKAIPIEGYSVTFAIKRLALQLISLHRPKGLNVTIPLLLPGGWDSGHVQIWPIKDTLEWPPESDLSDALFDLFTERWKTIVSPP